MVQSFSAKHALAEIDGKAQTWKTAGERAAETWPSVAVLAWERSSVVLLVLLLGGNPADVLQLTPLPRAGDFPNFSGAHGRRPGVGQFASVVLARYRGRLDASCSTRREGPIAHPRWYCYTDWTESACGSARRGHRVRFYCPTDKKVYIDLRFLQDLQAQLSAPGDFAMAYVIAHEVSHHVQQLLGTMDRVDAQLQNMSETESNQLSIRLELQADFYAGVWAHYLQELNVLEAGDIEEALNAASAVGDDRIQKADPRLYRARLDYHGTSEQRVRWFTKGWGDRRHEPGRHLQLGPSVIDGENRLLSNQIR